MLSELRYFLKYFRVKIANIAKLLFNNILKNKKEQKRLRTIHKQMFDVYVNKLTYATQATAKSYSKMIS